MEKNQKNNSQDFDFSVVEDKIQQVQNIIEKAVKSKDFQEMSQSVTQMVNKTLDQYKKEHPEMGKTREKPQADHRSDRESGSAANGEKLQMLYMKPTGEKVRSILLAVFGGILNGIAIVIALYGKASSGGTDFIAVYLSNKLKKPSWNFVFGINVVILMAAGLLFGFEEAMYSIIFQFVSTQIIERFHQRDQRVTLFIVTSKAQLLEQELMSYTHHGVTRLEGQGCYLKENKALLYTVVGADEVRDVVHLVKALDSKVFINTVKSEGITGRFYQEPLE